MYFARSAQLGPEGEIHLSDQDAWHLTRVLRSRPGDLITVLLDDGSERLVRLEQLAPEEVVGQVVSSTMARRDPSTRLHLLQALPKGAGMGEVCERVAELGVASVWPVVSERTVPRPEPRSAAARSQRWQTIAREAAQLAGRQWPPAVHEPLPLTAAIRELMDADPQVQLLVCEASEPRTALTSVAWEPTRATALLIGPEGGWSGAELAELSAMGAVTVSLGPRNLRTLLAGVVAVTVLLARGGDLEPRAA